MQWVELGVNLHFTFPLMFSSPIWPIRHTGPLPSEWSPKCIVHSDGVSGWALGWRALAGIPECKRWDEMCMVNDLWLRLNRCAVQALERPMSNMVTQERACWLNLSSISHSKKVQPLKAAVDPRGLFGPPMATIRCCCEEKKKEGEALRTCLPRKMQQPLPLTPCLCFAWGGRTPTTQLQDSKATHGTNQTFSTTQVWERGCVGQQTSCTSRQSR